jgi:hypothetical protein
VPCYQALWSRPFCRTGVTPSARRMCASALVPEAADNREVDDVLTEIRATRRARREERQRQEGQGGQGPQDATTTGNRAPFVAPAALTPQRALALAPPSTAVPPRAPARSTAPPPKPRAQALPSSPAPAKAPEDDVSPDALLRRDAILS